MSSEVKAKMSQDPHDRIIFSAIIDRAILNYKKAKRSRVENFTSPYNCMTLEASGNLCMEVNLCNWNLSTVNAIKFVLHEKEKYFDSK